MRDIHADTQTALAGEVLSPVGMVEILFDSGPFRVWTGIGELNWNGVWTGAGYLGRIGTIAETSEIKAVSVELELSAIPAEMLEIANNEDWQNSPVTIYYGVLDVVSFIGEPIQIFGGMVDQMVLTEGKEASITLTCESDQADLERTLARRYTHADQLAEYPGDLGFAQVAALQDAVITLPTS